MINLIKLKNLHQYINYEYIDKTRKIIGVFQYINIKLIILLISI